MTIRPRVDRTWAEPTSAVRRAAVLGVPLFVGTADAAVDTILAAATDGVGGYACFCNVHVMVTAQRDPDVMRALCGARMVLPDGAPIAWLLRHQGHPAAARVCGPDMMDRVLADPASRDRVRHYLLGSTPMVLDRLVTEIEGRYPQAAIAGRMSPGIAGLVDIDRQIDVASISRTRPDIVWCALGAPKQELWMLRNADALRPSLVLGVGAAFDFLAGTLARAPIWMQDHGLEWLHRAATEPRRLLPRYLSTNTRFLGYVTRDALARRGAGGSAS